MSRPAALAPAYEHHHDHRHPTEVHSPSSAVFEKRRKHYGHPNFGGGGGGGGGGDHHPPPGAYLHHGGPHHMNHPPPPPPHGYYVPPLPPPGSDESGPGVGPGGVGAGGGGGPPIPPHGYGYGPPPSPYHGGHHPPNHIMGGGGGVHPPPPPHDPYFSIRGGGGGPPPMPSPPEGYYLGHPPPPPPHPHPGSHYGPPPPPQPTQYSDPYGKYPPRGYLPPRLGGHHHHHHPFHQGDAGDYDQRPGKARRLLPPPPVAPPPSGCAAGAAASSPGYPASGGGGGNDDNDDDEANGGKGDASPNGVADDDDGDGVDDTRSPEGTRNLNTLEERVVPNSGGSVSDEQQQHHQQQRDGSSVASSQHTPQRGGGPPPPMTPRNNEDDGVGGPPNLHPHMAPYGMPHPPPGMMPYPHPPGAHHQYPPPTMLLPPSPRHRHHHHQYPGYPSPTSHHHPPPPHHLYPHHGPPPPGVPQFQSPYHSSPQHHQHHPGTPLPPPVHQAGGGGTGGPQPPRTPSNAGAVTGGGGGGGAIDSNGEMAWSCDYCNLKFSSWEGCSAHEASECPVAAAAYAHQIQMGYGPPHPPPPPPHGQYPPHMALLGGMMHHHQASPDAASSSSRTQHQRSHRGRKMTLSSFPNAGRLLVDEDAEYCINIDRPAYVLSIPDDGNSLSDRQCYVRSHFVEVFVAGVQDVGARHSRGAQKLNVGQVGLRCAYCVRLKSRDRAERAVCYPSSISRIYQTVADMQRFHFESCVAIPPAVLQTYKSLKTTRPRGKGSPQSYWDKSARDIGLVDTEDGIQITTGLLSCGRQGGDVFEMQRKSVVTGMLARLDEPAAAAATHDIGQGAMIMQGMMQGQAHMTMDEDVAYETSCFQRHQDPQVLVSPGRNGNSANQSAVVSSPGSEEDHNHDAGHIKNTMYSSPGINPSTPNSMPSSLVTPKESVEAEEDANILLMLKKTPESPPRNELSENVCIASSAAPVKEADGALATSTYASTVTEEEGFVTAL